MCVYLFKRGSFALQCWLWQGVLSGPHLRVWKRADQRLLGDCSSVDLLLSDSDKSVFPSLDVPFQSVGIYCEPCSVIDEYMPNTWWSWGACTQRMYSNSILSQYRWCVHAFCDVWGCNTNRKLHVWYPAPVSHSVSGMQSAILTHTYIHCWNWQLKSILLSPLCLNPPKAIFHVPLYTAILCFPIIQPCWFWLKWCTNSCCNFWYARLLNVSTIALFKKVYMGGVNLLEDLTVHSGAGHCCTAASAINKGSGFQSRWTCQDLTTAVTEFCKFLSTLNFSEV